MPDDETVCGETSADVWRHQVTILERRVAELHADLAKKTRLAEVGERAEKGVCLYLGLGCRVEAPTEAACVVCLLGEEERLLAESQAREVAKDAQIAKLREALTGLLDVCSCSNGCRPDDATCATSVARAALAPKADNAALEEVCERVALETKTAAMWALCSCCRESGEHKRWDEYEDITVEVDCDAGPVRDLGVKAIVARVLGGAAK